MRSKARWALHTHGNSCQKTRLAACGASAVREPSACPVLSIDAKDCSGGACDTGKSAYPRARRGPAAILPRRHAGPRPEGEVQRDFRLVTDPVRNRGSPLLGTRERAGLEMHAAGPYVLHRGSSQRAHGAVGRRWSAKVPRLSQGQQPSTPHPAPRGSRRGHGQVDEAAHPTDVACSPASQVITHRSYEDDVGNPLSRLGNQPGRSLLRPTASQRGFEPRRCAPICP